jgi:Ca2+:H+ antiporter
VAVAFEKPFLISSAWLTLYSGLGLIVPTAYYVTLRGNTEFAVTEEELKDDVVNISRITSVLLIIAYMVYVWFNMRTHHSIYDSLFAQDEQQDDDRHKDLKKPKLTLTECVIALTIAIGLVSLIAVFLVEEIPSIVKERGISETFMGLILVPLVEKFAEHLTAIDEAFDNTMNLAMSHVLGATIQTALFNAPLVVIVGWGLDKSMDLNFELFTIIVVILSVIVVGNFLRDQKSNYLEGALCVIVYVIIAVASFYFPALVDHTTGGETGVTEGGGTGETSGTGESTATESAAAAATEAVHLAARLVARAMA